MAKIIPLFIGAFILIGGLLSCDSDPPIKPCDTCQTPCDTCPPCDTCDTTDPCDTCDTTKGDPDSLAHAFTWTEYSIPGEVNITGCWVFNDNLIYAMGNKLWQWDGTQWQREKVIIRGTQREGAFADGTMFALSPTDMWFIAGWVYHYYEGSADELTPQQPGVTACWGTASNDMFFINSDGSIQHYDGEKFTKFPQVTSKRLSDIWGTSHNDVWACGFNSSTAETILLHYNGIEWTEDPISISKGIYATGGFNGVWAYDSVGHKFVTTSGALLIRKTDNNPWRSDSGKIPNGFGGGDYIGIAPRGNTADDFFVTGGWGFVAHWNGKTWKKYDELYDYSILDYGPGAFHVKGNTACVAGRKNGKSWIAIGRRKP